MEVTGLLAKHWLDLLVLLIVFFVITAQIIPPRMAGLDSEWWDNQGKRHPQRKQSFLEALMTAIVFTLNRSLLIVIGFKGAISLILFAVIGVELAFTHTISTNAVILAIVGILALHFAQIIDEADEVSVWKIFTYRRRK